MTARREILKLTAGSLILASVGGKLIWCPPARAAAAKADFRNLSGADGELLAALADIIVPGARDAGCAHFVDHHIGIPPAESLLSLRYLDVTPPYSDFYVEALASLRRLIGQSPSPAQWDIVIHHLLSASIAGWHGPPPGLFYFAVRSDAVDAVYGTREGFKRLGIDYLAHIEPETNW
jgi:hypothetical protein